MGRVTPTAHRTALPLQSISHAETEKPWAGLTRMIMISHKMSPLFTNTFCLFTKLMKNFSSHRIKKKKNESASLHISLFLNMKVYWSSVCIGSHHLGISWVGGCVAARSRGCRWRRPPGRESSPSRTPCHLQLLPQEYHTGAGPQGPSETVKVHAGFSLPSSSPSGFSQGPQIH